MSLCVRSPRPPGCQRTATRLTPGTACLSCSRHLPTNSGVRLDNPVTLPPGRARPLTSPLVTGSATPAKTIGMVLVACLAARAAGVFPVTMTSTLSATSSAARAGNRSSLARDVAARPRETGDESGRHRISRARKDDRNLLGRSLGRLSRRHTSYRHDDVDLRTDQFGGKLEKPFGLPLRPSVLNHDGLTFHMAELAERLPD